MLSLPSVLCSWSGSAASIWVQRATSGPVRVGQGAGLDVMASEGVKASQDHLVHLEERAEGVVVVGKESVVRKGCEAHKGIKGTKGITGNEGGQAQLVPKEHLGKMA